ncbi:hypothetical protein O9993_20585 [Vibrio lentus]|nr:hypothetical protein [Vibrio lentus]
MGYTTSSGKKKLYWCSLTSPTHTKSHCDFKMVASECCLKYQELFTTSINKAMTFIHLINLGNAPSERMVTDSTLVTFMSLMMQ